MSRCFARAVVASLRRKHGQAPRARQRLHASVLVVVQRFRYGLGLFVHLHALATDGAFARERAVPGQLQAVRWLAATAATERDLLAVLASVHRRIGRVDDDHDAIDPALTGCAQLSLDGPRRIAGPAPPRPLGVSALGMSLHAASVVDGRDRRRLERML